MQLLRDCQQQAGAQFNDSEILLSFGNDNQALKAAAIEVALHDRSHWGRLQLSGRDRLSFLHNQTSNDIKALQPGQGCETVLLTSTARTLDLLSVYVMEENILVLTSPQRRTENVSWLDRYIFFGDQVQLADVTDQTVCFGLIGPQSTELLHKLGVTDLPEVVDHHRMVFLANQSVRLAKGSGLSGQGYTVIASAADGAALWQVLSEAGAIPMGEQAWEQLRIRDGRPRTGSELTEDYNPLEAGLWHTVSFNKGCYIGQETIARLNTYNGVKQQLWGLELPQPLSPGESIYSANPNDSTQKIGILTSVTTEGELGLGYIKTKAGSAGLDVRIGEAIARVVEVPFLSRPVVSPN